MRREIGGNGMKQTQYGKFSPPFSHPSNSFFFFFNLNSNPVRQPIGRAPSPAQGGREFLGGAHGK